MRAATPDTEQDRLNDLARYRILDTGSEADFDDVVGLVSQICEMPVALISFVETERQWFKARHGTDATETPIGVSVCSHAILGDDLLEIPDTQADARTADNPLTIGPNDERMRFYAGAPLIAQSGLRLGTLCVLDVVPRRLTSLQRSTLQILARQIIRQLELRRVIRNEAVLRKEMDHRVKNSLQSVSSFVRLYDRRAHQPETHIALEAIGRRVDAIAQLHKELYQTSEYDMIPLDSYLGRLVALLQRQIPKNVTIQSKIDPVRVDSRRATSLGTIISEFIANSVEHAFPNGRVGRIEVTLDHGIDKMAHLVCQDNGIGSAASAPKTEDAISSIGRMLMESAAEQIGSSVQIAASADGYVLRLDFPELVDIDGITAFEP